MVVVGRPQVEALMLNAGTLGERAGAVAHGVIEPAMRAATFAS